MVFDPQLQDIIKRGYEFAVSARHEFFTPEHVLLQSLHASPVAKVLAMCDINIDQLRSRLEEYLNKEMAQSVQDEPIHSELFKKIIQGAFAHVQHVGRTTLTALDFLVSLFDESNCIGSHVLRQLGLTKYNLLRGVTRRGIENDILSSSVAHEEHVSDDDATLEHDALLDEDGELDEDGADGAASHGSAGARSKQKLTSLLKKYTTNLCELAEKGKLDMLIGRDQILEQTMHILGRRLKNNPIHVGDAGVGKTVITHGLAQAIVSKSAPLFLHNYTVFSLDISSIVAGTRFRGDFEERLNQIIGAIQKFERAIVFIDEIHTIVGTGASTGNALDLSNILKPLLASGEIRCIGATTHEEYRKYFQKDRALSRRFQKIDIPELSEAETIKVLKGIRSQYERYHNVRYSDAVLKSAVSLSAQYITDRCLPDKAIDVLDECGAAAKMERALVAADVVVGIKSRDVLTNWGVETSDAATHGDGRHNSNTVNARAANKGVADADATTQHATDAGDFSDGDDIASKDTDATGDGVTQDSAATAPKRAASTATDNDKTDNASGTGRSTKPNDDSNRDGAWLGDEDGDRILAELPPIIVTTAMVERIVSRIAHIPQKSVAMDEKERLRNLETTLQSVIFGQDDAVHEVTQAVKRGRAGFRAPNKPVASLLFVGSTGVGKTELARQLAQQLGVELLRFDMSEYQERHSMSRLIGSPPGYVGYDEGASLTDSIRKHPHAVLLLDEIEKAHHDLQHILLQIMDYATITDNAGLSADFRNIVLIMTSNAGARDTKKYSIGFDSTKLEKRATEGAINMLFSPEFRGRLDRVIHFNDLTEVQIALVVKREIKLFNQQLKEKGVRVRLTAKAVRYLTAQCIKKDAGARAVQQLVEKEIRSWFVDKVLFGALEDGGRVVVDCVDNRLQFAIVATPSSEKLHEQTQVSKSGAKKSGKPAPAT